MLERPCQADIAENVQFGTERQSLACEKIIILEHAHFAWDLWSALRKRRFPFADLLRPRMRRDQLSLASLELGPAQCCACRCDDVGRRSDRDERWRRVDVNRGCDAASRCQQTVSHANILP